MDDMVTTVPALQALQQKVDHLTEQVAFLAEAMRQQQQHAQAWNGFKGNSTPEKIDRLTEQVAFLAEEARQQQQRRQMWEELQRDLTPVFNEAFQLSVQQLQEIDRDVQLEDILRLFKRLLSNTRDLEQMLGQMESGLELWQELSALSCDMFLTLVKRLDEMERKGYFTFLQGGLDIVDRITTSFNEEDVRQLGENIVLILETVKEMTQPEIMNFMHNALAAAQDEEPVDTSMLSIIRQLNDPAVRKGLAKTLNVLKSISET